MFTTPVARCESPRTLVRAFRSGLAARLWPRWKRKWRLTSHAWLAIAALCISNTVPQALSAQNVTPDGGSLSVDANTTDNWVGFSVYNLMGSSQEVALSCYGTGSITDCSVQSSIVLNAEETATVWVSFSTGGAGSGNLVLMAEGTGGFDDGWYVVTVQEPPPAGGAEVTPDGAAMYANGSKSNQQRFVVRNPQQFTETYTLSASCSGSVTGCAVSGPLNVTLAPGLWHEAVVVYQGGAPGSTGVVTLQASNGAQTESGYVNVTNQYLSVSTGFNNNDTQDLASCASACFQATHSKSTTPYFSLDQPRSLTLTYHGDRVALRPYVYADVSLAPGHPTVHRYWLEARVNGTPVQFLNGTSSDGAGGETRLYFAVPPADTMTVRLTGQFDATVYATSGTAMYPLEIVAGIEYLSSPVEQRLISTKLLIVDERRSPVARGWAIAGVQRLHSQTSDNSALISNGDGTATYFATCGTGCFAAPPGEYSRLASSGTGTSLTYVRSYVDSAKATFNHLGQLIRFVSRLQDTTVFEYDVNGRLSKVRDPYRERKYTCTPTCLYEKAYLALTYDANGLSRIDEKLADFNDPNPQDRTTWVRVSGDSTLLSVKDPDGDSTRFSYDALRRLDTLHNRRGDRTKFLYDPRSWKLTRVDLPQVEIDAGNGGTVAVTPSVNYRPWHVVGMPTGPTSQTPATASRPVDITGIVIGPEHDSTRFTVDRWGAPLVVTDPAGGITTFTRENTLVTQVVMPWGETTIFNYSAPPLVTSIMRTGETGLQVEYDAYGQVRKTSGANRATREVFRGPRGRVDSISVAGIVSSRVYYGSRFRPDSIRDGGSHATKFRYDARTGSIDSTTLAGKRFIRRYLDYFGRDSVVKTAAAPARRLFYDKINRVTRLYDGISGDTTVFTYDQLFLNRVRDAKGQVHRRAVNALGWPTRVFDPADTLNAFRSYRYDRSGRLTSLTNRRGEMIDMRYDRIGRLVSKRGTNAVADSFWYSPDRRVVVGMNDVSRDEIYLGSTLWTDSVVTTLAGKRFRLRYYTDALARLDSLHVGSTTGILFAPRKYFWSQSHEGLDSLKVSGQRIRFSRRDDRYDDTTAFPPHGNVKRIDVFTSLHRSFESRIDDGQGGTSALEENLWRGYATDSLNRIRYYVTDLASSFREFSYDSLGQLRKEAFAWDNSAACISGYSGYPYVDYGFDCTPIPWQQPVFDSTRVATYDAAGNILTWSSEPGTRTYLPGNRISAKSGWEYSHDLDGNITRKLHTPTGADTRFRWSSEGLLLADSNAVSGEVVQFDYNAFGQLVRKRRNGSVSRHFLWDDQALLAELDSTATRRVAEYAYAGDADPIALITGAETIWAIRYFYQDALGNVIGLFSGSALDQTLDYNAWTGAVVAVTGTLADTNRLRWKGLIWDQSVTPLYYARNRWYDPEIGRFLSEDPIGILGGANLYLFAGADPVNGADPWGLFGAFPFVPQCDCMRVRFSHPTKDKGFPNHPHAPTSNVSANRNGALLRTGAEIGVGFVPIASTIQDLVTAAVGRNPITGDNVGIGGRMVALAGVFTPVSGAHITGVFKLGRQVLRKHHIFPQAFRPYFGKVVDIDQHIIQIPKDVHDWIHNGARGGMWNEAWRDYIRTHPTPDAADLYDFAQRLLDRFALRGPMSKY